MKFLASLTAASLLWVRGRRLDFLDSTPDVRSFRMTRTETKRKVEEMEPIKKKKKCYMLSVHVLPNYKSCKQEHNFHVTLKYIMYY